MRTGLFHIVVYAIAFLTGCDFKIPDVEETLQVEPDSVVFAPGKTQALLQIHNSGENSSVFSLTHIPSWTNIEIQGPDPEVHYAATDTIRGVKASETYEVLISATRQGLSPGTYQEFLRVETNNRTHSIPVTLIIAQGFVSGVVTDVISQDSLAGAIVSTSGMETTTDENGIYRLQVNLLDSRQKTFLLQVSLNNYVTNTANIVVQVDQVTSKNFAIRRTEYLTSISGRIFDADTNNPIVGAEVSTSGTQVTSNAEGAYLLKDLDLGESRSATFNLTVSKNGYSDSAVSVTGLLDQTTIQDIALNR